MLRISHLHITIIAWHFVGRPVTEKKKGPFKFSLHLGPPNLLLTTWSSAISVAFHDMSMGNHGKPPKKQRSNGRSLKGKIGKTPIWGFSFQRISSMVPVLREDQRQKDRPNNPSELRLSLAWTEKSLILRCHVLCNSFKSSSQQRQFADVFSAWPGSKTSGYSKISKNHPLEEILPLTFRENLLGLRLRLRSCKPVPRFMTWKKREFHNDSPPILHLSTHAYMYIYIHIHIYTHIIIMIIIIIYLSETTHTEYQPSNSWNKIISRNFWGPMLQGKLIIAVALRRLLECTKTFADHGQNPCYIGDSMPWFQSLLHNTLEDSSYFGSTLCFSSWNQSRQVDPDSCWKAWMNVKCLAV